MGRSRTFGVLPAADGGRVIWAVLEARRQRRSKSKGIRDPKPAADKQLAAGKPKRHELSRLLCADTHSPDGLS
jgi:hypothetical protein